MTEGDTVQFAGRPHTVFRIVGDWVGLVDPEREPFYSDKKNTKQVAHFAVRKEQLDAGS